MTIPNLFVLAAEDSPSLLPLLRSDSGLASSQDATGYSLLHAAASYNHIDLIKSLILEFQSDPNIVDEEGETPLFVVETVEAAQFLLEAKCDPLIRNHEGINAEEKLRGEGEFTIIADFLKETRTRESPASAGLIQDARLNGDSSHPPPLPPNVKIHLGTLEDEQSLGEIADPELRRRIEELASRGDFQGEGGQQQLRELITEALKGVSGEGRDVRQRLG